MKYGVAKYTVESSRLPKTFDGFKLVVISDLHDSKYGLDNISISFDLIRREPDAILIAGDLITGLADRDYTEVSRMLRMLNKIAPVYYGLGNHEVREHDNIKKYMEKIKTLPQLYILDNTSVKIERTTENGEKEAITISGLTLDKKHYSRRNRRAFMEDGYIQEKLGEKTEDFTILLAHHPDYFNNYAGWGADLIFSGHLHGGLVRLPLIGGLLSPQIKLFPKYDKGEFVKNSSTMIVSAGLGTHSVPRIFNPPELLVVELFSIEKS